MDFVYTFNKDENRCLFVELHAMLHAEYHGTKLFSWFSETGAFFKLKLKV